MSTVNEILLRKGDQVLTVSTDTAVLNAAELMNEHKIGALLVLDEGDLIGIFTERDVLQRVVAEQLNPVTTTVGDVMSRGVVTVGPDLSIYEAAKIMSVQDVKRLPVVDAEDRLLGVISRSDIVSIFTRPDDVIEDEIREDLIRRVLFVDPDQLDVEVQNGVITFVGEIGTRTEARLLTELASRLDGVLRVESRLTWRIDDT